MNVTLAQISQMMKYWEENTEFIGSVGDYVATSNQGDRLEVRVIFYLVPNIVKVRILNRIKFNKNGDVVIGVSAITDNLEYIYWVYRENEFEHASPGEEVEVSLPVWMEIVRGSRERLNGRVDSRDRGNS